MAGFLSRAPFNGQQILIFVVLIVLGILSWILTISACIIQHGLHIPIIDEKCIYPSSAAPTLGIIGAVVFFVMQMSMTVASVYILFGPGKRFLTVSGPGKRFLITCCDVFFLVTCWGLWVGTTMFLLAGGAHVGNPRGSQRSYIKWEWHCDSGPYDAFVAANFWIFITVVVDVFFYVYACGTRLFTSDPHVRPV